ncbi:hypothetical protein [uncultured Allofournierella sp.]|uniref:hypothetical protein n=1 Tax=uncultured Allofournierella sp. TaxID=1940258 RepID=UPI003752FB5F
MNRKILALGIVITLIAGFVACKALTKTTENTPTSEPTVQTESTQTDNIQTEAEDTTQQEETHYDFDAYTNQYKSDMGVTDEELLGNESLRDALYEWLLDGNISYEQAQQDKEAGCDNVLLDDYLAWLSGNNNNETTNETDNSTNQSTDTTTGANNTTSSGGVSSAVNSDKYLTEDGRVNLDALEADGLFDASGGMGDGISWTTEEDNRAAEEAAQGINERFQDTEAFEAVINELRDRGVNVQ